MDVNADLSDGPIRRTAHTRTLRSGSLIPAIGLGTFGSDRYGPDEVADAVEGGIRAGYRLVDCAAVYGNEEQVGQALERVLSDTVNREDLFIMSKVWNDSHDPAAATASVKKSLSDLRVSYLDAVFVHWPFPNHHAPFASSGTRDARARPYEHESYMMLWKALEDLVDEGLIRHLGTSNMTIPKLERLLRDCRLPPALSEMELHPCFQQPELFRFCVDHDIQPVGYSPLGSPSRPARDRTEEDLSDTEHPVVVRIAREHGVHPASVCIAWAVTRGQIPIPFAVKEEQYRSNFDAAARIILTPAQIEDLKGVERNNRLIKGQVFLWPGSTSWLDLWDVDGTIPGWDGYGRSNANAAT